MIQGMDLYGKLTAQKLLHCSVMLGLVKDKCLLRYCIPGSGIHSSQLKDEFGFERLDQVLQLIRVLKYHRPFTAIKA